MAEERRHTVDAAPARIGAPQVYNVDVSVRRAWILVRPQQRVFANTFHAESAVDASSRRYRPLFRSRGAGTFRRWPENRPLFQEECLMSIPHAKPGEVIQLPLGPTFRNSQTTTLVKTSDLELVRLVLPAGKEIPTHKAPGEITVQCLEGRVAFTVGSKTQELIVGQLLYLSATEPHSVRAIEDSSLLVTMLLPKK